MALEEVQLVCGVIKLLALFWWHSARLWFLLKICVLLQVLLAWWARRQKKADAYLWQQLKYGERVEWEQVVALFCLVVGRAVCAAQLLVIGFQSGKQGCLLWCGLLDVMVASHVPFGCLLKQIR